MTIGKMKPVATIVAQFAAGVEVEAIQHDGKVFLPVIGLGEFATKDDAPAHHAPTTAAPASKKEDKGDDTTTSKVYTEDELMDTDTKELLRICKDEFGIDPNDTEGKNTNKKLRKLILDAQENGDGVEEAPEEEPDKKPSKKSKSEKKDDDEGDGDGDNDDDLLDKVADLLEDFDAGKKNKKKTIAAIVALGDDDVDEDKVTELVEHFEEDGDADLDETAKDIADVLNGKVEKKPAKKSPKRGKKEDENLVDVDDLEVGDRVSVWWDDDNQEWYDGEVKSIKKGKVTIAYDDDTEEAIDPEVHTKIKRLAE